VGDLDDGRRGKSPAGALESLEGEVRERLHMKQNVDRAPNSLENPFIYVYLS